MRTKKQNDKIFVEYVRPKYILYYKVIESMAILWFENTCEKVRNNKKTTHCEVKQCAKCIMVKRLTQCALFCLSLLFFFVLRVLASCLQTSAYLSYVHLFLCVLFRKLVHATVRWYKLELINNIRWFPDKVIAEKETQ